MTAVLHKQLCPKERLKALINLSGSVEINDKISIKLYYESGVNMYKQFNIIYDQGCWENALTLYWKFEDLFFKKIKKHPDYAKVPVNVKSVNASNYRIMKPKGEHAKKELFKQYKKNYDYYIEELRASKLMYGKDITCGSDASVPVEQNNKRLSAFSAASSGTQYHPLSDQPQRGEISLIKSSLKEETKGCYDTVEIHSGMSFQTAIKLTEEVSRRTDLDKRLMLKEPGVPVTSGSKRISTVSRSSQKSKKSVSTN